MDTVREYLIGVIVTAILCGVITNVLDTKSLVGTTIKLMAGLLMLLAVIRPWVSISLDNIFDWTADITANGSGFVADGDRMAQEAYRKSIIERTRAYIVDEAKALNCELTVEVILSDDEIPIPKQVRLAGEVSPFARQALTNFMTENLGINREDQIWT